MKRIISMLLMLSLMTVSWALAEKQQDMESYTRYFDYQPIANEPIGLVPGTDHSTLVLYFAIASDNPLSSQDEVLQYIHSVQK